MIARWVTRVTMAVSAAALGLLVGAGAATAAEDNRDYGTPHTDIQIQSGFMPPF